MGVAFVFPSVENLLFPFRFSVLYTYETSRVSNLTSYFLPCHGKDKSTLGVFYLL